MVVQMKAGMKHRTELYECYIGWIEVVDRLMYVGEDSCVDRGGQMNWYAHFLSSHTFMKRRGEITSIRM